MDEDRSLHGDGDPVGSSEIELRAPTPHFREPLHHEGDRGVSLDFSGGIQDGLTLVVLYDLA